MAATEESMSQIDDSLASMPAQLHPLLNGIKQLYRSEELTDFEIHCQERLWKVHKFCLAAQSSYFHKICCGPFSESSDGKINLDDGDPQVLASFVHYLYHFDYDNFHETGLVPILLDLRMYVMADKYFIEPLKALAAKKFEECAVEWWNTRAFADEIGEVYQLTEAGKRNPLKATILKVVKEHARKLLDLSNPQDYFLDVLGENAEFAKDVAIATNNQPMTGKHYKCPSCDTTFTVDAMAKKFNCPRACTRKQETDYWDMYRTTKPRTPYLMAQSSCFK